eukprot:TRINITY_DN77184_c0_g1_i1.p1 TRINITY_DN77184_c0_g1~~TRINITY_DN77184_c0_g1_i1.p1  ORF type:complete len:240 (+),score=37.05 TRINITY_DN77184_c0_g1_i1:70-789(+)
MTTHEDDTTNDGPLSDESMGTKDEIIRNYVRKPGVSWRSGCPDYTRVNSLYFEGRTKRHAEGSLEAIMQLFVKNWEVESHHVLSPSDWTTMSHEKFCISTNGMSKVNAQGLSDVGRYNALLGDRTGLYNAAEQTYDSANRIFKEAFPDGFAFEVTDVFSGPPSVTFKWRHFGRFTGKFESGGKETVGTGEMVNLYGTCVMRVDENFMIEEMQVFCNPMEMIQPISAAALEDAPEARIGR